MPTLLTPSDKARSGHQEGNLRQAVTHADLARLAHKAGDAGRAAVHISHAVRLAPDHLDYQLHAAELFRRARRLDEAEAAARAAVAGLPNSPAAHNNLGLVLHDKGRWDEAEAAYRRALAADLDYPRAWANLGLLLLRRHRLDEAAACLRHALRLHPDHPQALLNLGVALAELGRLDEAEASLTRALQVNPSHAVAWHDLGTLRERRGRLAEAIAAYRRACDLRPADPAFLAALENARRRVCDWGGWADNVPRLLAASRASVARGDVGPLWPLASLRFPTTAAERLAIAAQHATRLANPVPRPTLPEPTRLRVGFLGHEVCNHVVGHLLQGLFERFDRQRVEVLVFDHSPDDGSPIRERIRAGCDRFIDVGPLTAAQTADRIATEGVHVLLCVSLYMPGRRPAVAARRPAPVQVNYLYPGTSGAAFIDYHVTDRVATPPGSERHFSERLVYLPDTYFPWTAGVAPSNDDRGRGHWGLPEAGFVHCSFNAPDKIDPDTFDAWARLLREVPDSVLWQRDDGPLPRANLRREAARRGVDPKRLVFAPRVGSVADHLARHRCADLFLDTFNHGAHATAADALAAGLPVLTCPGEPLASRVAASLLTTAGLPELIAAGREEYLATAARLARRPDELQALRERLKSNASLFDAGRMARQLEAAFFEMWANHRV